MLGFTYNKPNSEYMFYICITSVFRNMGVSRFKIFLYLVFIIQYTIAIKASEVGPNITMLFDGYNSRYTCVASGDETISQAQTFITPLLGAETGVSDFVIMNNNTADYNCDFEMKEKCGNFWKNRFSWTNSQKYRLHPVFDDRWNKFKLFRTKGYEQISGITITQRNFHVSVSIRGQSDAQILLCQSRAYACYWILIDAFQDKEQTIIRKCEYSVPDTYPDYKSACYKWRDSIKKPTKLLSESKWTHFIIARENNNRILLWETNEPDNPILNFTDTESPLRINEIYFRTYYLDSTIEWRVHDYNFLDLIPGELETQYPLISKLSSGKIKESCFYMYVALCAQCTMEITFQFASVEKTEHIEGTEEIFYKWRQIKITPDLSSLSATEPIHIFVKKSTKQREYVESPFWLIDDFRLCSSKDIKIGSLRIRSKPEISCESLQYPEWHFSRITSSNINADILQCSNPEFTGKFCDIDCSRINENEKYCNYKKICIPSKNGDSLCTCASGYSGNDCQTACSYGYYGYNCNKKCGKCSTRYCNQNSGICTSCQSEFVEPFCNTTRYPRLLNAPNVIETSYTSVTVQLNNISAAGLEDPTHFQIQYKPRYETTWYPFSHKDILSVGKEISIISLNKETTYFIRAVLFTKDGNSYNISDEDKDYDVPQVESRTKCEDITMRIEPDSRNVTIFAIETSYTCSVYNYNISLNLNDVSINRYDNFAVLQHFNNLDPYKTYEVILTYKFEPFKRSQQYFTTLEDAPSPVRNIIVEKVLDTEVLLTWKPPEIPNGVIREYIIRFQHVRYASCVTKSSGDENEISIPSNNNTTPSVTLQNLKPYSYYNVLVAAKTLRIGTLSEPLQFKTDSSVVSNDELPLLTSITITPSSTSARVDWTLPNCETIRGDLYYNISINCVYSEWCSEFETQQNVVRAGKSFQIFNLLPFTNYEMKVRAMYATSDYLTTEVVTKPFNTPAGVPPKVRNLTVYSIDVSSISLRWLPPYPPNGELDYYVSCNCKYYYTASCVAPAPTRIITMPCDLWEENYICFTLINLDTQYYYNIGIASKNQGVPNVSILSGIRQQAQQAISISSEPLNLCNKWENNTLTLYWNHPYLPGGPIKYFRIILSQVDTDIQHTNEKVIKLSLNVTNPMKTYTRKLKKTFQYSSSYEVTVYAITKFDGNPAKLIIHTPPETPQLSGELQLNENAITNSSIMIQIPPIEKTTRSKDSVMYVIVNELSPITKREAQVDLTSIDLEQIILDDCSISGAKKSWIALELNFVDMEIDIEIGDGTITTSSRLNKTINNIELTPETEYEICLLLINEYRTERSRMPYKLANIRTATTIIPSSGAVYVLLLLLLIIPAIIFYVYRRYRNKSQIATPGFGMPMRNVSASRQEGHHDPDIIPLTEDPSENNSSRNDVATVPTNSKKSTPANVSATATTNFHSRLVPLNKFEEYLKEAIESKELDKQHALFPRGQTKPWDYGMLKENKFKNRYNNLIAYDKNRVKLQKISKDYYSDYINASYIHGYRQENAYIATQGPKLTTVNDFWRMIWQEKVQYIVMLANVIEGGKKKCEKYWPEIDSSREYGLIDVHFEKFEIYADFEYRTFAITNNEEKRTVTQLHFTSWPDHGVPLYPQSLVPFLKKILTIPQSTAPIVVHCSAGVGRTGTIILCDICLRMAAREGQVDILRYLHEIREQRANMVDNIDQYKLVHMVLLECLLAPDTNIPCNANFSTTIQTLIDDGTLQVQLTNLQNTSWQDKALNFASTIQQNPLNVSKNRFPNIVPVTNQIYLPRYPLTDETSDYINAIPVDGFRFKEQFIVTQTPMPNTIVDFWRMVSEKSIKIIVSLNSIPTSDSTCCIFWPTENEEMQLTPRFNLKYNKLLSNINYDIHNITFEDNESEEQTLRIIQIVQFKNWDFPSVLPNNIENLVTLYEETENLSRGNYPMVVSCYDGATASGLFVAMSFVIEKIKLEQQCDPCLAVKVVRRNRKQFVKNKTQLECLYKSAVTYLNLFETYSNFDLLNELTAKN